jgi:cytoskeleton protein RodZ
VDSADNVQPRLPGAILAAERERQGLAPADIAQRLHMSVWQVEALEAGEYERLPRGTFLRGFVRNYAKMVSLPPDDLLACLAEATPRQPAPRIVVPSQNIRFDPMSDRMSNPYVKAAGLSALVIVLGFAAMYWWVFVRSASQPVAVRKPVEVAAPAPVIAAARPPPTAAASPPPSAAPVEPTPSPLPPSAPVTAVAPPTPAPIKPTAPSPAPPAKPEARPLVPVAATGSGGVIKLRFKGKSWVEVRDARGQILLTGLNDAGSETEVSGRPPFKVIVGNAPDVRLFFNDRELNLEPHMRDAVARMTVE